MRAHSPLGVERGVPATAGRVRDILKQIYGFAILYGEKGDYAEVKLAELQDGTPVKLTIEVPGAVHRDLVAYSDALAAQGAKAIEPTKLIVPMVSRFMNTDREFTRVKRPAERPR